MVGFLYGILLTPAFMVCSLFCIPYWAVKDRGWLWCIPGILIGLTYACLAPIIVPVALAIDDFKGGFKGL